ncbi:hypothetical protein VP01_2060g2 [Puccinia sorghi]|uniref:Uncharacterized protein n=1 Tax=Puccinia sorghi TaxID=27349 RepID=A0A0L6VBC2_9BASI|nr:hypothetical protein VP01_2060g2 [Puccinia sorghi]
MGRGQVLPQTWPVPVRPCGQQGTQRLTMMSVREPVLRVRECYFNIYAATLTSSTAIYFPIVGVVLVVNFFSLCHHGLNSAQVNFSCPRTADQGIEPMTKRLSQSNDQCYPGIGSGCSHHTPTPHFNFNFNFFHSTHKLTQPKNLADGSIWVFFLFNPSQVPSPFHLLCSRPPCDHPPPLPSSGCPPSLLYRINPTKLPYAEQGYPPSDIHHRTLLRQPCYPPSLTVISFVLGILSFFFFLSANAKKNRMRNSKHHLLKPNLTGQTLPAFECHSSSTSLLNLVQQSSARLLCQLILKSKLVRNEPQSIFFSSSLSLLSVIFISQLIIVFSHLLIPADKIKS